MTDQQVLEVLGYSMSANIPQCEAAVRLYLDGHHEMAMSLLTHLLGQVPLLATYLKLNHMNS